MLARSADRLGELEQEIEEAHAFPVDVSDYDGLRATLAEVKGRLGVPTVLLQNAVMGGFGSYETVKPEELEKRFQVNVSSLLVAGQALAPDMIEAGGGSIIVTGNTSAWRGKANFAGFAPTKAAQRILAQSMARSLGPQGVHVAYIVIDAVIDLPWTRERMPDAPDSFFIQPSGIADAAFMLVQQERSAWTFELDLRPYGESW
jgi:short-subunit dehydrogenase